MAKFNVVDMNGQRVSEIELSDAVFGITPNEKAVHIAVVNFLANQRQGHDCLLGSGSVTSMHTLAAEAATHGNGVDLSDLCAGEQGLDSLV